VSRERRRRLPWRQSPELERETADLEDAPLDGFRDLAEVAMAGVELAVCLGDADDGAGQIIGGEPGAAGVSAADEEAEVGVPVVCEAARYAARRLAVPPCAGLGHARFLLGARIVT